MVRRTKQSFAVLTAALAAFLSGGPHAWAQAVGDEFQVNTVTSGEQTVPMPATAANGDFVVVWQSYGSIGNDDSLSSIQGQRYASDGTARGGNFQVNTYTTSFQANPRLAVEPDGDFVVVWFADAQDGYGSAVMGRRYASDGTARDGEFLVNELTAFDQRDGFVATNASGDFVVAWQSYRGDGEGYSVQARRFASDGNARGAEFRVNTYTFASQYRHTVAMEPDGAFVVVWTSPFSGGNDTSSRSLHGQRFASDGSARGGEFEVNSYTTGGQFLPAVAVTPDGGFVVAWNSAGSDGGDTSSYSVQARRFASDGSALGPEVQVNTYTTSSQGQDGASIGVDADGGFVVVWSSYGSLETDSSSWSVQARRYASDGTALGVEFQANEQTADSQRRPRIAVAPSGSFVVAWHSAGQDGDGNGIFGRTFTFAPPITVSLSDATVTEGDTGRNSVAVQATLSAASATPVTVHFSTADGSAIVGVDYRIENGTVSFAPGQTSRPITVSAWGDLTDEPAETFYLNLDTPTGATIADGQATITILDNDPAVALSIGDSSVTETDTGFVGANFTVTASAPSGQTVTVDWATAPGTAVVGDYRSQTGSLSFAPGQTRKVLTVRVWGDLADEVDETFTVALTNPLNATIGDGSGEGTIADNDSATLSIGDVTVTEGDTGFVPANFTISMAGPSHQTVTVEWATSSGTAVPGPDYRQQTGTVSFSPGQVSRVVTVRVFGDVLAEGQEQFTVTLSNASNAAIGDGTAAGVITDNE